jgi:hypothetical protein
MCLEYLRIVALLFRFIQSLPYSIMPGLFSWSRTKATEPNSSSKNVATGYQYSAIGPQHIRLLRYAPGSKGSDIRLQIQVFDRRAKPPYAALSYVWGETNPRRTISLDGCRFDTGPNLYNALQSMRKGLPEWFWVDAICINQDNTTERNEQVQEMTKTYANATFVASWIGLCNASLELAFTLNVQTTNMTDLSPARRTAVHASVKHLSELQYWKRIWIQQELLLNPSIVLFCGQYTQPLHPLIDWTMHQYDGKHFTMSGIFSDLRRAVEWFRWRKAPVLRLLTWAGHAKHQSTDPRDKLYALLSQVVEHERAALQPYFPDYGLSLSQLLMVTLAHIRRFSGQRRASLQLDSVLVCFGEPGDSACGNAVRSYYWALQDAPIGADGQRSLRLSSRERRELRSRKLLKIDMNVLDVCDCIFSKELGSAAGLQVDVRSSRTWQRSEIWVADPKLSQELNHYWLVSYSKDMEDLGSNNRR